MKEETRKKYLHERDSFDKSLINDVEIDVLKRVLALDEYGRAKSVLVYVSTGSEVPTITLLKHCLLSKEVYLPKISEKGEFFLCKVSSLTQLEAGGNGILEPSVCVQGDLTDIDFIVVPGIVFDSKGFRFGYGKGHYDKLLSNFSGITVGLTYESHFVESLNHEDHDKPVKIIITEKQTHYVDS